MSGAEGGCTADVIANDVNALLQGHCTLIDAVERRDRELCRKLVERECTCAETRIFGRELPEEQSV